ncbi:MAG: hypothetical protein D3909_15010, partial [Candidatus Electrothrix sp. ATG1]|nr:hypothetical protein [Candidatus Electrothrix sp. ATG1]
MKVKIATIADELQMQFDESSAYFNTEDGEIYVVSTEELSAAEEGEPPIEDFPEWQQEAVKIAQQIISGDQYIALPTKYDVHQYAIMEEFCES